MGTLLILLGLILFGVGLVSVAKPIERLRIPSRKRGLQVAGVGFVVMMVGGALSPQPPDTGSSVASPSTSSSFAATTSTIEAVVLAESPTTTRVPATTTTTTTQLESSESPTTTESSSSTTSVVVPATTLPPALISYRIVETADVSFATTTRYSLRVVLEAGASPDDMRRVALAIRDTIRGTTDYDALNIFFYHYEGLSNDIYTLGKWVDAPYGDWGRADEANEDYSNFEIDEDLKNKNWSLLPTPDQVKVHELYYQVFEELDTDPLDAPRDEEILPIVADRAGMTLDQVYDVFDAIFLWIFDG